MDEVLLCALAFTLDLQHFIQKHCVLRILLLGSFERLVDRLDAESSCLQQFGSCLCIPQGSVHLDTSFCFQVGDIESAFFDDLRLFGKLMVLSSPIEWLPLELQAQ